MTMHYHFIGIGGTGLSAMARILVEQGHTVSGSDNKFSPMILELQKFGVTVNIGHSTQNITDASMIIRSSAIRDDNAEVIAASSLSIPVIKRRDFLKFLVGTQDCVAVAGTHGKTTTTAMISYLLTEINADPSFIVGSSIRNYSSNAHYGKGKWFVIEADEYDHMFLGLEPRIAVITHLEHDHPDCFPTMLDYKKAFEQFVKKVKPNGTLILSSDNPDTLSLLSSAPLQAQVLSYGFNPNSDIQAINLSPTAKGGYSFDVSIRGPDQDKNLARIDLQIPGKHNVQNALAAFTTLFVMGIPVEEISQKFVGFEGTSRRFEIVGEINGITLIDDYAHHPTEIKATLEAARLRYPDRRIFAVWQPHTFSRTVLLRHEFTDAFSDADHLFVTDVYAARESNSEFSIEEFAASVKNKDVTYISSLEAAVNLLSIKLQPNDVLIVLSAGDANQINTSLLKYFSKRNK